MPSGRLFELVRIDGDHWLIHDLRQPASDAKRVVACITETDDAFDVVWLDPSVPLPARYRSRDDILDDFLRWRGRRTASTRPVEIPSRPPFRASRRHRTA